MSGDVGIRRDTFGYVGIYPDKARVLLAKEHFCCSTVLNCLCLVTISLTAFQSHQCIGNNQANWTVPQQFCLQHSVPDCISSLLL